MVPHPEQKVRYCGHYNDELQGKRKEARMEYDVPASSMDGERKFLSTSLNPDCRSRGVEEVTEAIDRRLLYPFPRDRAKIR